MPINISYDDAKAALQRLAAERPDFVYSDPEYPTTCQYFTPEGQPSCIIGHVLAEHGLTPSILFSVPTAERENSEYLNTTNVRTLIRADIIDVDERTRDLLLIAQRDQDTGTAWGEAVTHAINSCEAADLYA